jgi:hypothetical protein
MVPASAAAQRPAEQIPPDRPSSTGEPQKALIDDTQLNDEVAAEPKQDQSALHEKFKKLLSGAKLVGLFTMDGKPLDDLTEESYQIEKVEKVDGADDLWLITSRIQYGKRDMTVPVPLQVKWAGSTPVLTLDDLTIPGFGTFSARVVLHKDKYAGTWQHDDVGGHLFGRIELSDGSKQQATSDD